MRCVEWEMGERNGEGEMFRAMDWAEKERSVERRMKGEWKGRGRRGGCLRDLTQSGIGNEK